MEMPEKDGRRMDQAIMALMQHSTLEKAAATLARLSQLNAFLGLFRGFAKISLFSATGGFENRCGEDLPTIFVTDDLAFCCFDVFAKH
jgi:hypothetical protein